jgi:replication factor C large subunit
MGEDDAFVLESRMSVKSMYDLMRDILHESDSRRARRTAMDVDETPEHIMMWLDENVPLEYKDPEDLHRAFQHLARTSTFLARVTRRQYFGFWSYANDHNVIGVCSAKSRPSRGWVQYRFPGYIMKMSRSKAFRSMRSGISSKISEHTHTSTRRSAQDVLPYLVQIFKADHEFRLAMIGDLGLSTEEVAFLLDKKVDSAEVKKLMLESEKARAAAAPSRPTPEMVEEKEERPERKPEPKGKQASLFEY